jgi:hypothetical protein
MSISGRIWVSTEVINWRLDADEDLIEFVRNENNIDVKHLH